MSRIQLNAAQQNILPGPQQILMRVLMVNAKRYASPKLLAVAVAPDKCTMTDKTQ